MEGGQALAAEANTQKLWGAEAQAGPGKDGARALREDEELVWDRALTFAGLFLSSWRSLANGLGAWLCLQYLFFALG